MQLVALENGVMTRVTILERSVAFITTFTTFT